MLGKSDIITALDQGRVVQVRSVLLGTGGELALEALVDSVIARTGRKEFANFLESIIQELTQNAFKASLKRIVFGELGLDLNKPEDYQRGIVNFAGYLQPEKIRVYKTKLDRQGYRFSLSMKYYHDAVIITVKNDFPLAPVEEQRIREKFRLVQQVENLYDFYLRYNDPSEGVGMGIAMIHFLLRESGLDCRNLTIFTDRKKGVTISRLILPLTEAYVLPRNLQSARDRNP